MEELFELREHIERGRYEEALALVGEMEEMSRDDKINKIGSYAEVLLLHLIKRTVEKRSTRSWDLSTWNAAYHIRRLNRRRKSGGAYLNDLELMETISEAFPPALRRAALGALDGRHTGPELGKMFDREQMVLLALDSIKNFQPDGDD
jgi:hypothetical protein